MLRLADCEAGIRDVLVAVGLMQLQSVNDINEQMLPIPECVRDKLSA